jgi:hypothetical protein
MIVIEEWKNDKVYPRAGGNKMKKKKKATTLDEQVAKLLRESRWSPQTHVDFLVEFIRAKGLMSELKDYIEYGFVKVDD